MSSIDFTAEEWLAIGDALDAAAKRTSEELKLARAKPYTRALEAQQKRYESLFSRVVAVVEKSGA